MRSLLLRAVLAGTVALTQVGCGSRLWKAVKENPGSYAAFALTFGFFDAAASGRSSTAGDDGTTFVLVSEPVGTGAVERSGAVHVYRLNGGELPTFVETISASDGERDDSFGECSAVSGSTIVIGAPRHDDKGSAYVFEWDGESWQQTAKLMAPDAENYDSFGQRVAIDGDVVVVGSPFDDTAAGNAGAAYVFRRTGQNWSYESKLTADDASDDAGFGSALAVRGDTILAAAPSADGGSTYAGVVYAYQWEDDSWNQSSKLEGTNWSGGLGSTLRWDHDQILIAESGANVVHLYDFDGETWTQDAELTGSDTADDDQFGSSVYREGNVVVVGASRAEGNEAETGAAYVFVNEGSSWTELHKLMASDGVTRDGFGLSVGIVERVVMVGAPYATIDGYDRAGALYGFVLPEEGSHSYTAERLTRTMLGPHSLRMLRGVARDATVW